jgi:hypothetical protein
LKDSIFFGIHKSLLLNTFGIVISCVLVVVMGLLLIANVFMPQALFLEPPDLSSKIAFVFFGSILAVFGFIGGITTFLNYQKVTRIVLGTHPESIRIRFLEETWIDSKELIVESGASRYLARRPKWFKKDLLETPLEAEGYFDAQRNMSAVKLQQGLIWISSSYEGSDKT